MGDLTVDLTGFPGAPFAATVLDAAIEELRGILGWHVASDAIRTETLTADHHGTGTELVLKTRKLVTVTAVRDVSVTPAVVLTGWRMDKTAGILHRDDGWPTGDAVVEVDVTHGYIGLPADLRPALAALCLQASAGGSVASMSIDDFAVRLRDQDGAAGTGGPALQRYSARIGF